MSRVSPEINVVMIITIRYLKMHWLLHVIEKHFFYRPSWLMLSWFFPYWKAMTMCFLLHTKLLAIQKQHSKKILTIFPHFFHNKAQFIKYQPYPSTFASINLTLRRFIKIRFFKVRQKNDWFPYCVMIFFF